ncbi:MAG: FRG domain-containing protein [Planctomycetes bacterium]|nr:FRG domain-containing protein [Planctomycetota bacterium]
MKDLSNFPSSGPPVSDIRQYVERVFDWNARFSKTYLRPDALWYRGANAPHKLLPKLYRNKHNEYHYQALFKAHAPKYLQGEIADEWDFVTQMQHYGCRTRLLDWTLNPLAALHFALQGYKCKSKPCVWFMNAQYLNWLSLHKGPDCHNDAGWLVGANLNYVRYLCYEQWCSLLAKDPTLDDHRLKIVDLADGGGSVVSVPKKALSARCRAMQCDELRKEEQGPLIREWLYPQVGQREENNGSPKKRWFLYRHNTHNNRVYNNALPIAVMPRRLEPRILAQQGTFTVHGTCKRPIEDYFAKEAPESPKHFMRIDIVPDKIEELQRSLRALGINELVLFPELASVGPYVNALCDQFE